MTIKPAVEAGSIYSSLLTDCCHCSVKHLKAI